MFLCSWKARRLNILPTQDENIKTYVIFYVLSFIFYDYYQFDIVVVKHQEEEKKKKMELDWEV